MILMFHSQNLFYLVKFIKDRFYQINKLFNREKISEHTRVERYIVEWWKDKQFVAELDRRYQALEKGTDKGYTLEQLEASIQKLRKNKYGK